MENHEKLKLVEKALERFWQEVKIHGWKGWRIDNEFLTKQAILARCTIEHYSPKVSPSEPYTQVFMEDDNDGEGPALSLDGLQLREGEALCIILSLEKE